MKKILTLTMTIVALFLSGSSFAAIWGTLSVCTGGTSTLIHDSVSTSGTWSSSNMAIATVNPTTGATMGLSVGTCIISWNGSAGLSTAVFTVNPAPAAIAGGTAPFCAGTTVTLTNTVPGGTWSSTNLSVATVGSTTGVVYGVNSGVSNIRYALGTSAGCIVTKQVTVNFSSYPDTVSGPSSVCIGSTITLSATASGGTWSSSNASVATVSATGVVSGIATGTAIISHTSTGVCGPVYGTRTITVTSTTSPGTISGPTSVAIGATITLTNSVSGGTWSSSTPSVGTISTGGVVSGISAGVTVITYTVSGCSGVASTTTTITVTTPNCISGNVLFTGTPYYGPVKVWLIKYNPSTLMLSAADSTYVYCSGTTVAYQFCGMGTDSFRVKAACDSPSTTSYGYIPTYHTASGYWNTATVIYHVAGTHDINKNITMGSGTPTTGPVFIAGNVTTGANKGTADGDPVAGMLVFCVNISTGAILQSTVTNAAGLFSFSNLPVGEAFRIYPEAINYGTTPYPAITLTSGTPSMTLANFIQHTLSMTITPVVVNNVEDVTTAASGIVVFPNPATSTINIAWNNASAGTATYTITDVTGRAVINRSVTMGNGTGNSRINISHLSKGLYMITIKGDNVSYTGKLVIE
jgi:uncharacterized protein YjdB